MMYQYKTPLNNREERKECVETTWKGLVGRSVSLSTPFRPCLSIFLLSFSVSHTTGTSKTRNKQSKPLLFCCTIFFSSNMAMVSIAAASVSNVVVGLRPMLLSTSSFHSSPLPLLHLPTTLYPHSLATTRPLLSQKCFVAKDDLPKIQKEEEVELRENSETILNSFSPLPLLFAAALLPGAGAVSSAFGPFVELVKSWNLPSWLVHWGHPGNMAVVLFAMGGYGTYLGFRIRYSDDVEEKAKAKDLHPKLLAGMFFFFALGATGGITSLLTSDKPIFESPHAVTGVIGLALLTIQTILPSLFEGNPGLRNVHGILGSGIMTLFLIHAALGLRLGLSY